MCVRGVLEDLPRLPELDEIAGAMGENDIVHRPCNGSVTFR
jgi:hypothetical protein